MATILHKQDQTDTSISDRTQGEVTYTPRVDILENADELWLYADLPGVTPKDLDIRFENKELTIYGKVTARRKGNYLYSEYGVGDFNKTFSLSEMIDSEKISADLKDGVLVLHLPKTEAIKPKRIEVKSS